MSSASYEPLLLLCHGVEDRSFTSRPPLQSLFRWFRSFSSVSVWFLEPKAETPPLSKSIAIGRSLISEKSSTCATRCTVSGLTCYPRASSVHGRGEPEPVKFELLPSEMSSLATAFVHCCSVHKYGIPNWRTAVHSLYRVQWKSTLDTFCS